jgi:hypothetical protein
MVNYQKFEKRVFREMMKATADTASGWVSV